MGFKHFSSNPDYTGTDMFRIILDDPVDWDDSFSVDAPPVLVEPARFDISMTYLTTA
jgi:hypothetical protein